MSIYNRSTERAAGHWGSTVGALLGALFYKTWGWTAVAIYAGVCLLGGLAALWTDVTQKDV